MTHYRPLSGKPRRGERALSPALSTVILTSSIIVLVLVAVLFANNFLNLRIAQNEFDAMKQFMQTIGLQIDYVAWIKGQTQTSRFASRYGYVSTYPVFLNYSVYLNGSPSPSFSYLTSILLFNMPINNYNIAPDYYEQIIPSLSSSFLQSGPSALVTRVYVIEKLPMTDGSFLRIVAAPCIRAMNSTVSIGSPINYTKLYLPLLSRGLLVGNSQSVTLTGSGVTLDTPGPVNSVVTRVSFPNATLGFGSSFFNFANITETVRIAAGSTIELYTGEVKVSLGLYG